MAKNGVDLLGWETVVNRATNASADIKHYQALVFSKTNLTPFTDFDSLITDYNSALDKLQGFMKSDGKKMIQAGKNKEADDAAGQNNFKGK